MAVALITANANGNSAALALPMKYQLYQGAGVSLLLNFSNGGPAAGTATVQVSNDANANPFATAAQQATARWNAHDILFGMTGDKNSSIVYPVAYLRLVVTNYAGGVIALLVGYFDYAQ